MPRPAPSVRVGVPATRSIAASIATSAIAVPRSGSASSKPQKTTVRSPIGLQSSGSDCGGRWRVRYEAAQTASAIFASSEGWKTRRPEGQPAAGAVHRLPDHEYREEQAEARHDEGRGEPAQDPEVEPRRTDHQRDAEDRVDRLALEVVPGRRSPARPRPRSRCRPSLGRTRRGRASPGSRDARLELSAFHPDRFCTSLLNSSPRSSKSRNWS